jgi:hypothetical protein
MVASPSRGEGRTYSSYLKNGFTRVSSSRTNSASMNAYLSGISRQTMCLPLRYLRNRVDTLLRWDFSITKIMSAHSTCSDESCCSEMAFNPAESVSTSGQVEKMCSAVGLRSLLAPQMKRRRFMERFYREQFVCPPTHALSMVGPRPDQPDFTLGVKSGSSAQGR